MPFPTAVQTTSGIRLLVQRSLPDRVLPVITMTTTAAVAAGLTTIPITALVAPVGAGYAVGDVLMQEGDSFTFNSTIPTRVTLTANVLAGATSISVLPTVTAIQSGNIATSNGFLLLLGANDASFKIGDKLVPTRAFESGIYDENIKVMLSAEISVSGFYRVGDPSIRQVVEPASLTLDREVAWRLVYPNGQFRSGFGLVQGFEDSNKLDDIRGFKFTLKCNGAFQTDTQV